MRTKPDTWLWSMTDHHDDRFHLYVEKPDQDGTVIVGIEEVYTKYLDPDEARGMAAALLTAAGEAQQIKDAADRERAERERLREQCEQLGGHDWPPIDDWMWPPPDAWICRRCGSRPETQVHVITYDPRKATA